MPRREWIENLVMMAAIVAWWPYIFAPLVPSFAFASGPLYRAFLFGVTPVPLLVILVLRLLRYRQAVKEAEQTAEQRDRPPSPR